MAQRTKAKKNIKSTSRRSHYKKQAKIAVITSAANHIRCTMYDAKNLKPINDGIVTGIGSRRAQVRFKDTKKVIAKNITNHNDALHTLLVHWLEKDHTLLQQIKRVGHKITHGGEVFIKPTVLDKKVYQYLWKTKEHVPYHHPGQVLGLEAAVGLLPDIPHVAVFDTMFFADIPAYQFLYALPHHLYDTYGIRRYAFQGLGHETALHALSHTLKKDWKKIRVISCIVDKPSSVASFSKGEVFDATMSFVPLGEQAVCSRFFETDPMVVLSLIQDHGFKPEQLEVLLPEHAGGSGHDASLTLSKAIKCISTKRRATKKVLEARMVVDMFIYDVQRNLATATGMLGKVDAVVLSGKLLAEIPTLAKIITAGVPALKGVKIIKVSTDESELIARYTRDIK